MNLVVRWSAALVRPELAAREFLAGRRGGMGDGLVLSLLVSLALYPDWVLRAILTGWYVGLKAGFMDLALLLRLEFLPVVLALLGLGILGLVAGLVAGSKGVGLGKWFDLAGMALVALPAVRLVAGWFRFQRQRPLPGELGWDWYLGLGWAAVAMVWMAVALRSQGRGSRPGAAT